MANNCSEQTRNLRSEAAKRRWADPVFKEMVSRKLRKRISVLCGCGCGELTALGKKFVHGHNARVAHPMRGRKMPEALINKLRALHLGKPSPMAGKHHSEASRKKMRASHKGVPLSKEHIKNRAESRSKNGYRHSEETLRKISAGNKGKIISEGAKRKNSESNRGKRRSPGTEFKKGFTPWIAGRKHSDETKKQLSATHKKLFLSHEFVKKMAKAWNVKPNKPETYILNLLNELYPGQWKYTGDFSFTINGKCPDFVNCNGQKKVIELFGDYWHRGQNPQDRINAFRPFGFDTLVIWEHELKDIDSVIKKLNEFAEVA